MLILIAIVMLILVMASTWWFGLWSNLITLINLIISAMLASSIYEPVADKLLSFNSSFEVLYDFIAVWLVFAVSFFILRAITDVLSAYRVRFDPITELVGRSILSLWTALVFICFSFFTLQMAPLSPEVYGTDIPLSEMGTIPDRAWLSLIQSRSRGALSAGKTAAWFMDDYELEPHPDDADLDARVFDPRSRFLEFYDDHRKKVSQMEQLRK